MRLRGLPVGVALLFCVAPRAQAVAPIFTETPLRGTRAAAAMLDLLARKPPGVDRAEPLRATATRQYRALVILLQFPPDPAIPLDPGMLADTLAHPPAAYDSILFSVGTLLSGSFRDYYREISRDAFDVDGVVTRWYTAPHPYSYYTDSQSGLGSPPMNAQQMARDAAALADADYDFRQFDNDGPDGVPSSGDDDGFVDGLFVVHAGPGAEETARPSDIASHKWNMTIPYTSGDGGVQAYVYTTEPEKWAGNAPHTAPNQLMTIGTFCHEFGHVLGLPDLYDTRDDPAASEGIGEWDVMGSGSFNHALGESLGMRPAHMSAWSKQTLGWVSPTVLFSDQAAVSIPAVETGGPVYRLWTDGDNTGEYFLIENRQPIGFDAGLVRRSVEIDHQPAHGLVIYHLDDSVMGGNNNAAHKLVDVEEAGGGEGPGAQNLDLHRRAMLSQTSCGAAMDVTGNRGDQYDSWPGALSATDFSSGSCPSSSSYCGEPSQVAVQNISESAGMITADIRVKGAAVIRRALVLDDALGDGNGKAEPGESVRLRFPLLNLNGSPSPPLHAKISSLDRYTTITAGDSIDYGMIGPAATDSGTTVEVAVNSAPDPIGAGFLFSLRSAAGLVHADTVQLLVGSRTGLCEDFEAGVRRWYGVPVTCFSPNEWHREAGFNHTPGGAWAWRLGPAGLGSYAGDQDSRLVSPPVRLTGANDTLSFWQQYDTQSAFDGLSVEISTDGAASWTLVHPVPDYPSNDRWSGFQGAFAQAKVPLTGYGGVVQFAFRFRSDPSAVGLGWWIDDVAVNGDATCSTTGVEIADFDAVYAPEMGAALIRWDLGGMGYSSVGIDRAPEGGGRARVATPSGYFGPGRYEDRDVTPGRSYLYWLVAEREGSPRVEYGPVRLNVPALAPPVLALGPVRPNPFNPDAALTFSLDRDGAFALRVYRADGALVRTLREGSGILGTYTIRWDGRDGRGAPLPTGVYLIQLQCGGRSRIAKAILLR